MSPLDQRDTPFPPETVGRLLGQHAAALQLYAAQWTRDAEDCVQEAFIELAGQTTSVKDPVAWLYRVVRNRALNMARGARRRKRRESEHAAAGENWFHENMETRLDGQQVTAALRQLPDCERETIIARLWGGLTFGQIAELTSTSTSSVHRHWLAGLSQLRERLDTPCTTKSEPPTTSRD